MYSLSAHLRSPYDHGRLAFHPVCPVCDGERLVGVLPSESMISRRAQAVLASGVLAISAASPAAALTAEPDQEQQGSLAPDQVAGAGPSESPGYDPGGEATGLPLDDQAAVPPATPGGDADGVNALDPEPANDTEAPTVDAGDEGDGPSPSEENSGSAVSAPSVPTSPQLLSQ